MYSFLFAAQTVDCDLGYTLGASQSTFLLCSYINFGPRATRLMIELVSMDWRPEKRLNCRRLVLAYIVLNIRVRFIY